MLLYARPIMQDVVRFALQVQPRPFWPSCIKTLALWRRAMRTRQQLDTLNDRELADVGLSRTQQRVECAKPFWQL